MDKYGFVYLWRDKGKNRYYIGCHWGTEDDGYICSSNWMRMSYKRRPNDFSREILKTNIQSKEELVNEEYKWLQTIPKIELGIRYYNLKNQKFPFPLKEKGMTGKKHKEETKRKISETLTGHLYSEESKIKMSESHKGQSIWLGRNHSEETKKKMSEFRKGRQVSEETKKKISQSTKGIKKHSEETKRKMSQSAKKRKIGVK